MVLKLLHLILAPRKNRMSTEVAQHALQNQRRPMAAGCAHRRNVRRMVALWASHVKTISRNPPQETSKTPIAPAAFFTQAHAILPPL
jgi:hypothetical protein